MIPSTTEEVLPEAKEEATTLEVLTKEVAEGEEEEEVVAEATRETM